MTKKWFEIIANILFWLLTSWLITNSFSLQVQEIEIINDVETVVMERNNVVFVQLLTTILFSVFLFYLNFWNILRLSKGKATTPIIIKSIGLFILIVLIHYLIRTVFLFPGQLMLMPSFSWGIFIFYFTISIAYGIAKVLQKSEGQKQQLAIEKKQAELSLLRSQLHPHFLFNVLNNLLSMVDQKNNPALASSLDKLSGLLRYVVYDTVDNKVSIRKEIDFINNFAELQSLRFEQDELDFDLKVIGSNDEQEIEPGIFIPFIENAFKYGIEPEKQSQIKVVFDLSEENKVLFRVENAILPAMQQHKGNGSGIQSSKERLKLVYPNRHEIVLDENHYFKVSIIIETDESNNSG